MSLPEYFGEALRERRRAAKLSQTALGQKVGKTKQTIAAIENATQGTTFEVIEDISTALGVPVASFFPSLLLTKEVSEIDRMRDQIRAKASGVKAEHVKTVLAILECLSESGHDELTGQDDGDFSDDD